MAIRVTVWNEFLHERHNPRVREIYPEGMHAVIAAALRAAGCEVRTATLEEPEHGLPEEVLANTDVLTWWGHGAHERVSDDVVERVHRRVTEDGMGLIVLHSGHYSKIFRRLMGTSCSLKWREVGEKERIWVLEPGHPIARGLPECIVIPHVEMYGERFDIPAPDTLVFCSWFQGGEIFRSGCCYHRGRGKVFYFRPGHETFPIYHQAEVQQVLVNAVAWAQPSGGPAHNFHRKDPLEPIPGIWPRPS